MYVPQNQSTCVSPPWDPHNGDAARLEEWNLTQSITAAQGAFDLSTYRPDLAPNGWNWGEFVTQGERWGRNVEDFLGGAAAVGIPLPGKFGGGGGDQWVNGVGPDGSPSNPRVIDTPFCTPLSTMSCVIPPTRSEACYGTVVGNYISAPQIPMGPVQLPPTVDAQYFHPKRRPSGDLCSDIRDGFVNRDNVDEATLFQCQQTTGMAGLGGLGACGNPAICSGNPTLSPADRARNGHSPSWIWLLAVGAVVLYASKGKG